MKSGGVLLLGLVLLVVGCVVGEFAPLHLAPGGDLRCTRPEDIWPHSVTKVTVSVDSSFIAYTIPRAVNILNIESKAISQFTFIDGCRFEINSTKFTYFGNYGRSIAASDEALVVGAPNLYKEFIGNFSYSQIKVFSLPINTTDPGEDIFDYTTPDLGTFVAVATDGHFMTTFYDETQIAIYQPVTGRQSGQIDRSGSKLYGDGFYVFPDYFWFDSMAVSENIKNFAYFILTGCSDKTRNGAFVMAKYNFDTRTSETLTPSSTDGIPLVYTPDECDLTPSAQFPVALTPDGSRAIVGSNSVGCLQLFEFYMNEDFYYLNTSLCQRHVNGFGRDVDFVDDYTIVVSDADRVYVLNWDQVWNYAYECPIGWCFIEDFLMYVGYSYPNRRQYPSTWGKDFSSLAASDSVITAAIASDQLDEYPVTPLYIQSSGEGYEFSTDELKNVPCQKGNYKDASGFGLCVLCPAGTYQDEIGATDCKLCSIGEYCPLGSVNNKIELEMLESFDTLPEFPAEPGEHAPFEEILMIFLFSARKPSLWLALSFFLVIIIVDIIYKWRKNRGSKGRSCFMRILGAVVNAVKWVAETQVEQKEIEEEMIGTAEHVHRSHLDHKTFGEEKPIKKELKVWGGICAIIFYYFTFIAIGFTLFYFYTYNNPGLLHAIVEDENIKYTSTSILRGINQGELENEEYVDKLLEAPFNLTINFMGFSGFLCENDTIKFEMSNCYTTDYLPCSDVVNKDTLVIEQEGDNCLVTIIIPETATLPAAIDLSLPETSFMSAISLMYSRETWSPQGHFTEKNSTSEIVFMFLQEEGNYEKELSFTQIAAVPRFDLVLIPFLYWTQTDDIATVDYNIDGYVSATGILKPTLVDPVNYVYNGPFDRFTYHMDLSVNTFYVINTKERAVQLQYLILILVLGLIGVLHVLEFIESMVNKAIYVFKTSNARRRRFSRRQKMKKRASQESKNRPLLENLEEEDEGSV